MDIVDQAVSAVDEHDKGETAQLDKARAHWNTLKERKKQRVAKLGGEDGLIKLKESVRNVSKIPAAPGPDGCARRAASPPA
jgi:hypothetical protein